jgi:U32 family peptidase
MSPPLPPRKPEVMSPAGHWPQLGAAIEAGADAVYFGLRHFTARAKVGFSLEELPDAMRTLHARGVRGYVTFNSLVFDHELDEAARTIAEIARAGADAIIVQDLGILELARRIAPDLPRHASTQMSLTSAEGIRLAESLGASRVILARELSLADVRAIRAATLCELEMFVHGALCVSYSGQCFSSEAWGGRSANRGQCAQTCRMPYEMIVDGEPRPLGDARYLLSPGDLYALHQVPEIVRMGLSALKIEGRYKDADYVALTTRAYREAVDRAWEGLAIAIAPAGELRLEQVYSRGFGAYFVSGTDHQKVVNGRAPRHRGVRMGRVARVHADGVVIEPAEAHRIVPLKPGDGIVFDAADWRSPEEPEEGGRVYQALDRGDGKLELRFANRAIDGSRIRPGDLVWRTDDPDAARAAKPFTDASAPVRKQKVRVRVTAREGTPLTTEWALAEHPSQTVCVTSEPLRTASRRALSEDLLRDQFARLGNTPYELETVTADIQGSPFAPASVLNQVRRDAVERLAALQSRAPAIEVRDAALVLRDLKAESLPAARQTPGQPRLHLLVRTADQLEAAIGMRPASVTLDYLELYGLAPSVERVRAAGVEARVASPRMLKPAEERIVHFLLKLDCPILVRSTGLLSSLRQREHPVLIGDFSLNAANAISAGELLRMRIERLTPGHDLNAAQVAELARQIGAERLEAVAYQHLPVFHTEHCVFCRFLSTGTDHENCGHPCEKHRVALRDVGGRAHPVMADVGCRNTVFAAEAQQASAHLAAWLAAGIRHFRLEFVHESPAQVELVTGAFGDALAGRRVADLARRLRDASPQGIAEGSLFIAPDYLSLPVLQ